jgi:hypothetical protein
MFAGVITGVIGKMLIHVDIVTVFGILLSIAGMFMVAYPYLSPLPRRKRDVILPPNPQILTPSETTKKLPQISDLDFVSSVTEGTTDLLKTPAANSRDTSTDH